MIAPAALAPRPLLALTVPFDGVRLRVLRALAPWIRPFVAARQRRVALTASALVVTALAGSLVAPVWMLVLGPLVWGIPHIAADLRYLVLRPGLHRRWAFWLAVAAPVFAAACGGGARAGLVATAGALVVARGSLRRRALGLGLVALAGVGVVALGRSADLVFAHAHHLVTLGIWAAWRPREARAFRVPALLFVLATGAIVVGVGPWAGAPFGGESLASLAARLGPGLPLALATRLVVAFAFAQALHYGAWLRLVPEDDRAQPTPRSFAQSVRALCADLGPAAVVALVVLVAFALGWSAVDLAGARAAYARASWFHGHLELAAAAWLWAERR